GSPEYMSPEQATGSQNLDPRTDVWSLCVVLYELLTGHLPFRGNNANSVMLAIVKEPPQPTSVRFGGDAALWAIIEPGFHKGREKRGPTRGALGAALAAWAVENELSLDATGASIAQRWLSDRSQGRRIGRPLSDLEPLSGDLRDSASLSITEKHAALQPGRSL